MMQGNTRNLFRMGQRLTVGAYLHFRVLLAGQHLRFIGHELALFGKRFHFCDLSCSSFLLQSFADTSRQGAQINLFFHFQNGAVRRDAYIFGMSANGELKFILKLSIFHFARISADRGSLALLIGVFWTAAGNSDFCRVFSLTAANATTQVAKPNKPTNNIRTFIHFLWFIYLFSELNKPQSIIPP